MRLCLLCRRRRKIIFVVMRAAPCIITGMATSSTREWQRLATRQRQASAYHEAGHAVVGYYFGAWLNPEGVEIDARQYTGLRFRPWDYTTETRVIVSMAGWLAEHKYHRGGRRGFVNEDTAYCLEAVRDGMDEERKAQAQLNRQHR
jgi:hypothetical protein